MSTVLAGSLLSTTAWTRQRRARPDRPEPSNEGPRPRGANAGGTRQERPQAAERLRGQLLCKAKASTSQSQAWEPLSSAHVPVRPEPLKETAPARFYRLTQWYGSSRPPCFTEARVARARRTRRSRENKNNSHR